MSKVITLPIFKQAVALALILLFIFTLDAFGFTEPGSAPPGGNVPAPLNVGSTGQAKTGGLQLNTGGAPIGLIVQNGGVGVLTTALSSGLRLDVHGNVGADAYCDRNGSNCTAPPFGSPSFSFTEIRDTTGWSPGGTWSCPAGQKILSCSSLLVPSGQQGCNTNISSSGNSCTVDPCGAVSGQTGYHTEITCGGV